MKDNQFRSNRNQATTKERSSSLRKEARENQGTYQFD